MTNKKVRIGLLAAVCVMPTGLGAAPVDETSVDEILVTGTRLRDDAVVGAFPRSQLDRAAIQASGEVTLENILQDLPVVTGGDFGSTLNLSGEGLATVSLRGLGAHRTLVLINGQRPAPVGAEGVVDLNLIPTAAIERVDILREGASTIYGSDAIAGVVNIITRRDLDGFDFDVSYGTTDESDGEEYSASAAWGRTFTRGNVVLGAQYTERKEIWQGDRDFSACAFGEGDMDSDGVTDRFCSGSPLAYPALFITESDGYFLVVDPDTGQVRDFTWEDPDTYNFAPASFLVTPQDVVSLYGSAGYDLIEDSAFSTVRAVLQVNWANRESDQMWAPDATFWIPEVPASNPFNPFGDDLCAANAAAGCVAPESVYLARRLVETAGRNVIQDAEALQIVGGFEGRFANDWTWQATYNYATFDDTRIDTNRTWTSRLETILDPAACTADPACPGVWNPFATGTLTPALQAYALANPVEDIESTLKSLQLNLQGDLGAFELPGGRIAWATGVEYRTEEASSVPDPLAAAGEIYALAGVPLDGDSDVKEAYGEVRLPLLQGAPLAELLAVTASLRWSDYDFLDSSETTAKFGIEWAPTREVRFRGSFTEGFRAPNIRERLTPAEFAGQAYADPCADYGTAADPVVAANCASEGLPPDFAGGPQGQAVAVLSGSQDLEPESADSWTLGVTLTPIENLSVSLDWFDVEIEDAIGTASTANIVSGCYASPGFSSPLCALIGGPALVGEPADPGSPFRNITGDITGIDLTQANLQTFETSGLDAQVTWGFDTGLGRVGLDLTGTYLSKFRFQSAAGTPVLDYAGKFGADPFVGVQAAFPEFKADLTASLARDAWDASWRVRWLDGVDDLAPAPGALATSTGSTFYHDVRGRYRWERMSLTAGVRNLFDRDPPYISSYDDMNTIYTSYDTTGRVYYLQGALSFR